MGKLRLKKYLPWVLPPLIFATLLGAFLWSTKEDFDPKRLAKAQIHQEGSALPADEILNQPFTYLAKGCQSYAFVSADQRYVLKFLKSRHFSPSKLTHWSWLPGIFQRWVAKSNARHRKKLDQISMSFLVAFNSAREETGVELVHLGCGGDKRREIALIDLQNRIHPIVLDDYIFFLQRKAIALEGILDEIRSGSSAWQMKLCLKAVIALTKERCKKGVGDGDSAVVQNTAIWPTRTPEGDYRALFIDVGQFFEDPSLKEKEAIQREVTFRMHSIFCWIKDQAPELMSSFKEALRELEISTAGPEWDFDIV